MFDNKSQNELRLRRCSDSKHHFISMSYCYAYIWSIAELLRLFFSFLPVVGIFSCQFPLSLKFAQHYNTIIVYKCYKWGMKKKSHWEFLESSSKARLCVYRLGKGWAQACGACTLLQHCLVNQLTAVAIPPPPTSNTHTDPRACPARQTDSAITSI